jgi:hypothetical protein
MAIQRVELPEVESIIGDSFPVRDEDAYRREAKSSTTAAHAARGGRMVMVANAGYTEDQFLGQTGGALAGVFGERVHGFGRDHARYTNVAAWLNVGAHNIETTKVEMNRAMAGYHDAYGQTVDLARREAWPQARLVQAKSELAADARQTVADLKSRYQIRHEQVQRGVQTGEPVPLAHVDPKPPPKDAGDSSHGVPDPNDIRPYACYLGSKDNDPVRVCGPKPALHTWYVDKGRFVQLEGATVSDSAKVEISAGPGEVMETSVDPSGHVGEVKVWLPGPPSSQDFRKWSQGGQVDVNFWWQNPDGSLAFDRRMRTGAVVFQGSMAPGPDWGY